MIVHLAYSLDYKYLDYTEAALKIGAQVACYTLCTAQVWIVYGVIMPILQII